MACYYSQACQFQVPSVVNALVDGVPAFDTNDVFAPHPIEKGWYKMFGRADDQIVHSTGEKTNPGPLGNGFRYMNL